MNDSTLRIFVGSDERMGLAEIALERSIRAHASCDVELTWMRAGDPPNFHDWEIGRPYGQPYTKGWGTDFTCFRYAVPQLADFEGRALYLDVDMVVLGDVRELLEWKMAQPLHVVGSKFDVILWDCARMKGVLPLLHEMKSSGWGSGQYRKRLPQAGQLPEEWDRRDSYVPGGTKLIHFTQMRTQPWKPWPEAFDYKAPHPDPRACKIFWKWAGEPEGVES